MMMPLLLTVWEGIGRRGHVLLIGCILMIGSCGGGRRRGSSSSDRLVFTVIVVWRRRVVVPVLGVLWGNSDGGGGHRVEGGMVVVHPLVNGQTVECGVCCRCWRKKGGERQREREVGR